MYHFAANILCGVRGTKTANYGNRNSGWERGNMEDPIIVLLSLCGGLMLLQIVKWILSSRAARGKETSIGQCMTIGDREVQEDCYSSLVTGSGLMAVLADGMGKAFGGRIASRIAVDCLVDYFKEYHAFDNPQYYFRKAFHAANREILRELEDERRGGASVGAVLIRDFYLYYAVVGNVLVSVYRNEELVPVSTGHTIHTLAESRFSEGRISRQDALILLKNHRLFNYLGQEEFRDIELFDTPIKLNSGDLVVLMSDGVYELLSYQEIEAVLSEKTNCQDKALRLIETVNRQKQLNKDNASIILIEIGKGGSF